MTILVDPNGTETARAIQLAGRFHFDGIVYPKGSWIVLLAGGQRLVLRPAMWDQAREWLGQDAAT